MLVQIYVDEDIDVSVKIVRTSKAAATVHQPAPQHVVVRQEDVAEPAAQAPPARVEQVQEQEKLTDRIDTRLSDRSKPVLLFIGSTFQRASVNSPSKITAGAWVATDSVSPGLSLMRNLMSNATKITKQLSDVGAVYAVLTSPQLQELMKGRATLHINSSVSRTVRLVHTAQGSCCKYDAAVAVQIRRLVAKLPFKVLFFQYQSRKVRRPAPVAAGLKQALALANRCDKYQQTCELPAPCPGKLGQ